MPRKTLIRSKNLPYHVTARSNNKEWFTLPMPEMWELAQQSFREAINIINVEVISFVLMGNHYHMLILTPDGNLDTFMYEFNKRLALKIKSKIGQINKIFGGRYKWCLIESQHYLINCYKYVYQNPIRARLVQNCEDSIPIHDKYGFKDEFGLRCLNQKIDSEEIEDGVIARLNPTTLEIESLEILSFKKRLETNPSFSLPIMAKFFKSA